MAFDSSEEALRDMEEERHSVVTHREDGKGGKDDMNGSAAELGDRRRKDIGSAPQAGGTPVPGKRQKGRGGPRRKRKRKKKESSIAIKIFVIVSFLLVSGVIGYLGYLFYDVRTVDQPDIPQDQLVYKYPGEMSAVEGRWTYEPGTVAFRRQKAYEKEGVEYLFKVIPVYQKEKVYSNDIRLLSEEPPFFGQIHIGSFKTVNDMSEGEITSHAGKRMDDILYYFNVRDLGLLEQKVLEYGIDGNKAHYSEFTATLPPGADEPDYVTGRNVRIVLVHWTSEEDRSGKYFIGFSVVRIRSQGNLLIPSAIEDETTWDKILSLVPRVSVDA